MFHRVSDELGDGVTTSDNFEISLKKIIRNYQVMDLSEMLKRKKQQSLPPNTVALTFDDGYADFYTTIFPLLTKHNLPATLFITSSFIDGDFWFWPDKIRYILDKMDSNPFSLPEFNFPEIDPSDRYNSWNILADYCLPLDIALREKFIKSLSKVAKVDIPDCPTQLYRAVNWDQLKEMHQKGLAVGSHTITHPILSSVDCETLRFEIGGSKALIEDKLGASIEIFCYPNGMKTDFNKVVENEVRESGYRHAVTAFPTQDPLEKNYQISRYPVSNNQIQFEKSLYGYTYQKIWLYNKFGF